MNTPIAISFASGLIWGLIVVITFSDGGSLSKMSTPVWFACIIAPIVGVIIYFMSRWSYQSRLRVRVIWAIASVYIAAAMYALCVGLIGYISGDYAYPESSHCS